MNNKNDLEFPWEDDIQENEVKIPEGWDCYEYQLSGHWASAIINGDYSGLEDTEEKQLNNWLESLPKVNGHIDGFDERDSLGFCRDDITGLFSDCFKVRLMFQMKDKAP